MSDGLWVHIQGDDIYEQLAMRLRSSPASLRQSVAKPHPGRSKGIGSADVTRAWLEAEFARGRIRP